MAQVNFATTLPEHALAVMRDRARQDGMPLGDWLARAIYDKATRDGFSEREHDPAEDPDRSLFMDDSEAERLRHFQRSEHRADSA
jgi:hypothetical protein